jgi:crotonobetainyl-CoA:carnitine CoA-transferase CaiB-like acyl-CoA transferase
MLWLSGAEGSPPRAIGLLPADIMSGEILLQGILAGLVGRGRTGVGTHVETSLFEACLEGQLDAIPMFLNRGRVQPPRSRTGNAGLVYQDAPYGVFQTSDGYIAIGALLEPGFSQLMGGEVPAHNAASPWADVRDQRLEAMASLLRQKPTAHWLKRIGELKGWAVEVLDWAGMASSEAP